MAATNEVCDSRVENNPQIPENKHIYYACPDFFLKVPIISDLS